MCIRDSYKAVTEFAISNGCVPMVWDINAGKGMSMLNRTTLKIDNANMMDGITGICFCNSKIPLFKHIFKTSLRYLVPFNRCSLLFGNNISVSLSLIHI